MSKHLNDLRIKKNVSLVLRSAVRAIVAGKSRYVWAGLEHSIGEVNVPGI